METSDQLKSEISRIGFDLDNTLYPSTPEMQSRIRGRIYEILSEKLNVDVEKARDLFEENYEGQYAWSHSGYRTVQHLAKQYGKTIDIDVVQVAMETANILDFIEPNEEVVSMLERLSDRYDLDLITGSNPEPARQKLQRIGIDSEIFECFFANAGSKTSGEVYKMWLDQIKVPASKLLYLGDNVKQDIIAPQRLGIKACLVGKQSPEARFSIPNILELEKFLLGN